MMIDEIVNAINSSFVGEPTPQEAVLRQGIEALNEGNQPIYRTQSRGLFRRGSEEILEGHTWDSVNPGLETIANETINDQPTHFAFNAMLLMNEIEYQTAVADGNLDLAKTNRNNKAEILDRMKRVLYAVAEGVDLPNTPHYESSRTKVVRDIADIARKGGNPHEAFDLLGNPEITQDKNILLERGQLKYDTGDIDTAEHNLSAAYDMDSKGAVGKEASRLLANLYNEKASPIDQLRVIRDGVEASILTEFDNAQTLDGNLRFTKAKIAYTKVLNTLNERAPETLVQDQPDPNRPYEILKAATLRQLARYDVGDGKIKSAVDLFRESITTYATKEAYQGLAGVHSKIAAPTQG